jgi:hypothetical protein
VSAGVDVTAVLVAGTAAFLVGAAWYAVFGARLAATGDTPPPGGRPPLWRLAAELVRGLVLALVVADLAARGGADSWTDGLRLGLTLWVGFPAVLWSGAILWEGTPLGVAAIHAGDWLVKLVAVAVIVAARS